eukprot:gene18271-20091_t
MGIFQSKVSNNLITPESTDELTDDSEFSHKERNSNSNKRKSVNNYDLLKRQGFDVYETIGFGAYSIVKRGYYRYRRESVAIKIVDRRKVPKVVRRKFLPREVEILCGSSHANILHCFGAIKSTTMIYMIVELVENGDLLSFVVKNDYIEERMATKMFKGIASAVRYLHENNIAHRDLKLENVLLTKDLVPKLSDFGFTRIAEHSELCKTYCGSAAYAPLEILTGTPYDAFKVDVWCLGVMLYAMTIGYMPFNEMNHVKEMKKGVSYKDSKQPITTELQELIKQILVINPKARPKAAEILSHDWLKEEERSECEIRQISS